MREEIRAALDLLFEAHAERKRREQRIRDERERKEAAFLWAFLACGDRTIKPAMQSIGEHARANGLEFRIDESEKDAAAGWNTKSPEYSIRFILGEDRFGPEYQQPSVTVTCDQYTQRVIFHETTMGPGRGGHSGQTGSVALSELTEDLIHTKVLRVLEEILQ